MPNCKSKPFARHHDLERHFKIHRGDDEHFNCDYKKYPHKEPFRKDHCREQYREYHAEDLIKRCQPHYSNPKHSQKKSEKKSEMVEDFLASRLDNINLDWWRCSKCAQRVQVNDHGYTCPKCSIACELERIALGEKDSISRNPGLDMETTERLSTEEKTSLMVQEIAWQRYGSILTSLEDHGEKFSVEITSFDCRCFFWYKAFYPASLIAGFSMMGLFLWSNQRMELETSSDFVQQVC